MGGLTAQGYSEYISEEIESVETEIKKLEASKKKRGLSQMSKEDDNEEGVVPSKKMETTEGNAPRHRVFKFMKPSARIEAAQIEAPTASSVVEVPRKKGSWTPDEKAKFLTGLEKFGQCKGKWAKIAELIGTKSKGE